MRCPFCGSEARQTDVCEHCGGLLPQAPEPGLGAGISASAVVASGTPVRPPVALTAQVADLTQPVAVPASLDRTQPVPPPGGYGPPPPVPYGPPQAPGAYGRPPSVYAGAPPAAAPGAPIGPRTMGIHASYVLPASAITPTMVASAASPYRVPAGEKWEKCLALTMPTLLLCALVVHFFPTPGVLWGMLFFGTFVMGLLIGASAAVPSYDDCYADVGIIMIITVLLGPTIGIIAYVVTALIRQEFNTAMLALGVANIVMRIVLFAATGTGVLGLIIAVIFSFFSMSSFTIATCFLGWILSSFFRPLDE